jgi:hypothetical protein
MLRLVPQSGLREGKCHTPNATRFQLLVALQVRILLLDRVISWQLLQHGMMKALKEVQVAVGIAQRCSGKKAKR